MTKLLKPLSETSLRKKVSLVSHLLYEETLFLALSLHCYNVSFSCLITECSVDMLDQRVADLSSVLDKLRSVSTKDQDLSKSTNKASSSDWKVCFFFVSCSAGERLLLLICFFNFENRVVIMLANYFFFLACR